MVINLHFEEDLILLNNCGELKPPEKLWRPLIPALISEMRFIN